MQSSSLSDVEVKKFLITMGNMPYGHQYCRLFAQQAIMSFYHSNIQQLIILLGWFLNRRFFCCEATNTSNRVSKSQRRLRIIYSMISRLKESLSFERRRRASLKYIWSTWRPTPHRAISHAFSFSFEFFIRDRAEANVRAWKKQRK